MLFIKSEPTIYNPTSQQMVFDLTFAAVRLVICFSEYYERQSPYKA